VNTILDSLGAIVAGNISAAAKLVEDSLAKAIPLVIGFLASLLGLGDFGAKIRGVMDKVREPVNLAIDWVLTKVVNPLVGFAGRGAEWAMGKAKAGAAWVKGKAGEARAWGREKVEGLKTRFRGPRQDGEAHPPGRDPRRLAAELLMSRAHGYQTPAELRALVGEVRAELQPKGLRRLYLQPADVTGGFYVMAQASDPVPIARAESEKKESPPPPQTAAVTLQARLVFDKAAIPSLERAGGGGLEFHEYDVRRARKSRYPGELYGRQQAAPGKEVPPDQPRYGSFLVKPKEADAKEVIIKAWNSGDPTLESNASHAERFFFPWLDAALREGSGLTEVHVQINLSPCSRCSSMFPDLTKFAGLKAGLTYVMAYEERSKRKGEQTILGDGTTTAAALREMGAKGWEVSGPEPRWRDAAAVRAEREAAVRIALTEAPRR
jgi:hypothetical protein